MVLASVAMRFRGKLLEGYVGYDGFAESYETARRFESAELARPVVYMLVDILGTEFESITYISED